MTFGTNPVIVDMFCGSGGESQGIIKQIGNAVCPLIAEALTMDYMRKLKGVAT
jgi:site-specific DNA-cytosine methylase